MTTILDNIILRKKKELGKLKKIAQSIRKTDEPKRSLIRLLEKAQGMSIIAEYKRASPSKGDINTKLDPKVQTRKYVDSGADAVSVLTDTPFFKGTFEDLKEVRTVIETPILCKDFIIDPIQIELADKMGADLILLIAAALDDESLKTFYELAKERNLEVLMEVHNEEEAYRVLKTGNPLIGVNNRNLKTFEVDLSVTERLAPIIKREGAFLISESGIKTIHDVERVAKVGANGILVGEAFMTDEQFIQSIKTMKEVSVQ